MTTYEGRHRPSPARPQGRHRASSTKTRQLRLVGVPAGVAVAATVGGAAVAGIAPMPFGSRTLAIDPGPQEISDAAGIKANAARPTAVATPPRTLPGAASRDRTVERPQPKTSKSPAKKPTSAKSKKANPPAKPQNPWTCAVADCVGPLTSGFGARISPGGIGSTYHEGDDFAVAWGTPLRAMHQGTVVATGWDSGLGNHVTIDYGNGVQSVYGHMSSIIVRPGQWLARGQSVGYSGDTGHSTGPHLHLEIHLAGVPINPAPWLQARGIF